MSTRSLQRSRLALALGIVLLLGLMVLTLRVGAIAITWADLWNLLLGSKGPNFEGHASIILQLRLPRSLMAALVGSILALSGLVLQGLLRNSLASPSLLGISSGGALFAAAAIVGQQSLLQGFAHPSLLPLAAFFGCGLTSLWMLSLARMQGRTDTGLLILGGVAINSLAGAGTGLLSFFADDAQLRSITFWSLGSVAGSTWQQVVTVAFFAIPALLILPSMASTLNALLLGEEEAQFLGISVEAQKRLALLLVSLALGAGVAYTGIIGFVGLVVPHLLRLWIGADHRYLMVSTSLYGAALLLGSDLLARTLAAPLELPLGVVTGAIGSPYLLYLLRRFKAAHSA